MVQVPAHGHSPKISRAKISVLAKGDSVFLNQMSIVARYSSESSGFGPREHGEVSPARNCVSCKDPNSLNA